MKLSEQGVVREEALLAYLNNELSVEDKQQLEKLLDGDPFAQEALEGLKESGKASAATAVISINKKVRERVGIKETRMAKLHWSTYAWAAVVFGLLIGVGFVMVTYMSNKQEGTIAMNDPAKQENVNLLEEKKETTAPVSATTETVTDSTMVYLQATDNNTTTVTPAAGTGTYYSNSNAVGDQFKTGNADATLNKGVAPAATSNQPAVTINGTTNGATSTYKYTMNSTVLADDKGTAPAAKPVISGNVAAADAKTAARKDADALEKAKRQAPPAAPAEGKNDKQVAGYTTQSVVRGSIIEKEETDRVTVITMEDAMKSFNSQDYKKSADQFGEILKQQPNNADALYFGGISDYINGNAKKSEKNFDKLLKEGTKYSEGSKWYKANILLKKGKRDDAKKLLDELANSGGSYKERAIKKKAEMEF